MVTRRVAAALGALGAACASAVASAVAATSAGAHPLHVTYADVAVARGTATVTLRVYTDDLLRAAGGAGGVDAYVRAHFALADAAGRPIALASCGAAVHGDMTHLCLRGAASGPGVRVTNDLLVTLYADQINVVRSSAGRTALFTRTRRAQAL
ncbi:hypothetical protein J421_6236 (plasmid) [Gemmatirosa kalamazoonensis]|uniref:Uncharacterized protein n=1 Tax=Gemmatirosa kalamazoonensis TaxID=861299 RepID=W0RSW9_9BACT|nr:DUF6702 family protein [Gemmatirosa kalamazoonensis]AHG93771.1 hypothetical protein J421_6236 [Gemmatirosa kalamazoonensis]